MSCPLIRAGLKMHTRLAVGFGVVCVTRDGTKIWSGDDEKATLMRFENLARKAPDHDWRILFVSAMSDRTYQRQGKNCWVLVEKGQGFA